jgi:beta-lactamase class A
MSSILTGKTLMLSRRDLLSAGLAISLAPLASHAATVGARPQDVANLGAPDHELEAKIAALEHDAGIPSLGFAAVDLAKGRTAFLREGELFPQLGLNKLAIAVAFMRLVEQGKANLNRKVRLTAADIAPGRSPVAARLKVRPTNFTARQLIEHMLLNGDNTATDALLHLAGGPATIQAVLNRIGGLDGLRIDRYERVIQAEAHGLKPSAAFADPAAFDAAFNALGPDRQKKALERFVADARDTASPRSIALLYFKILSGHLLELQHTTFLLDLMRRTKTGLDRLNAGMLPGWTLAHRGGQSKAVQGTSAVYNDSGLATHKSGARIVIVVMTGSATLETAVLAKFQHDIAATVLGAWG